MRARRPEHLLLIASTTVSALSGVLANIGTSKLPDWLTPYQWFAWPLFAVTVLVSIALVLRQQRGGAVEGASRDRRADLLAAVRAKVQRDLQDRLPRGRRPVTIQLAERPGLVLAPRPIVRPERTRSARLLQRDTPIDKAFDDHGGALLIVGEKGAGKTTLLEQLALSLLDRARADATTPVPVILNLASWAPVQPSLDDWIVEQLRNYTVGRDLAREWLAEGALTLLLDGLDEVAEAHRDACVQSINAFRAGHELQWVAVCCRLATYTALAQKLTLSGAVELQALDAQQVGDYLRSTAGLSGLAAVWQDVDAYRELLTTPLMLDVAAEALAGISADELRAVPADRLHPQLWSRYVERMFERFRHAQRFPEPSVRHWLGWLARTLRAQGVSDLYLERMQPTWLTTPFVRTYRLFDGTLVGLATGIVAALAFAPSAGPVTAILHGLGMGVLLGFDSAGLVAARPGRRFNWKAALGLGSYGALVGWRLGGPTGGLAAGLALGTGGGFLVDDVYDLQTVKPVEVVRRSWHAFASALPTSMMIGTAAGVAAGVIGLGRVGVSRIGLALTIGLMLGLALAVENGWATDAVETRRMRQPNEGIRRSARYAVYGALRGVVGGGLIALVSVEFARRLALPVNPWFVLTMALIAAYFNALINGLGAVMSHVALRLTLRRAGVAPWNYVALLDYACDLAILKRTYGGYTFWHLDLRDYLAAGPADGQPSLEHVGSARA